MATDDISIRAARLIAEHPPQPGDKRCCNNG